MGHKAHPLTGRGNRDVSPGPQDSPAYLSRNRPPSAAARRCLRLPGLPPGPQPHGPVPPAPAPRPLPSPPSSAPPPPPRRPRSPNTRHLEQSRPPRGLGLITGPALIAACITLFHFKESAEKPGPADNRK